MQNESSQNYLEWYYLPDATQVQTPANIPNSADGQNQLKSAPYVKLSVETAPENYSSNYIKSKKYDPTYNDLWIPFVTGNGATASTYFCDYASLVNSRLVRSVRLGGTWYSGAYAGFSYANAANHPATASAHYGGDLWIIQNAG